MKVYAKFIEDKTTGLEFRRNTILQFGDSWNVIGSIILINPGSAKPILNKLTNESEIKNISKIVKQEINAEEWFEFNPDSTMRQVEKLFRNGYLKPNNPNLNGVILLFNLFNLRDANLEQALMKLEGCEKKNMFTLKEDIKLIGKEPLYIGWGKVASGKKGCNETLNKYANDAFKEIKANNKGRYLDDNFDKNSFYHPGYINRSYNTESQKSLLQIFADKELNCK